MTGIYTGSAESNELSLAEVLTENMPGSEVTCDSNRVWITKTHWPVIDDQFKPKSFSAQKCIVLVRNPLDIFVRLANLTNLGSHFLQPKHGIHTYRESWERLVENAARQLNGTMQAVINNLIKSIPCYVIRYEDLELKREEILTELFCFLLDAPSIEGTIVEKRIKNLANLNIPRGSNSEQFIESINDIPYEEMYTEG